MDYGEAVRYIHSQKRFGPKPGLERIEKLLASAGDPQEKLRFIHVAGTNGKGSTTAMIAGVLREAGYRTGLFVSPFVLEFRERFQVDGTMIPKEDLARITEELRPAVDRMNEAGETVAEFELVTAIGMVWFLEQKCDFVCLETGIGGRLDSTNVIPPPVAAVIGPVSFDHMDILGDTIEAIAAEKAGIIKEKTDAVCYAEQSAQALGTIMERCALTGGRLILPNPSAVSEVRMTPFGSSFSYDGETYRLRLAGEHQILNALSVIEVIRLLRGKGFAVSGEALKNGLEKTSFPARQEVLSQRPLVILDGAHNPDAAKALVEAVSRIPGKKIGIAGMLKDKSHLEVLRLAAPAFEKLITVGIDSPRALSAEDLQKEAAAFCPDCECVPDHEKALEEALFLAGEEGTVVIFGSLYLASEIRETAMKMLVEDGRSSDAG